MAVEAGEFLCRWLLEHILKADLPSKPYLMRLA
jgi:hemerythrin